MRGRCSWTGGREEDPPPVIRTALSRRCSQGCIHPSPSFLPALVSRLAWGHFSSSTPLCRLCRLPAPPRLLHFTAFIRADLQRRLTGVRTGDETEADVLRHSGETAFHRAAAAETEGHAQRADSEAERGVSGLETNVTPLSIHAYIPAIRWFSFPGFDWSVASVSPLTAAAAHPPVSPCSVLPADEPMARLESDLTTLSLPSSFCLSLRRDERLQQ
jgi:hypothetical protein